MTEQPVPINFRLTPRASKAIKRLSREALRADAEASIPVIMWSEEYEEPTRKHAGRLVEKGLSLGWFHRHAIPAAAIQQIDGLELVFGIHPADAAKFAGRTIDFVDGRFSFAPK